MTATTTATTMPLPNAVPDDSHNHNHTSMGTTNNGSHASHLPHKMNGSMSGSEPMDNHSERSQDEVAELTLTQEEQDELQQVLKMTQTDTNRVNRLRYMVTLVLVATAVVITFTTYKLLKNEERDNFETAFEQFSRTVAIAAVQQQRDLREGLITLENALAAYAATNLAPEEQWPFITLPMFETYARNAIQQGHLETMNFLPLVSHENRAKWVDYANQHYQQWVHEGHYLQKGSLERLVGGEETYHNFISARQADGSFVNQTEEELYFVSWQYSPPPATYDLINGNLFSVPYFADLRQGIFDLQNETVITRVFKHVGIPTAMTKEEHDKLHSKLLDTRAENPHSFFLHPIHRATTTPQETGEIVGVLAGAFAWDVALLHLLPEGVRGLHAVIRNTCNQSYTYEIEGPDAYFLGAEDLHESNYNDMEVTVALNLHQHPNFTSTPGHCQYSMHIYPSSEFQASYDSNTPETFAIAVAVTFGVVAVVFFLYDVFVQRRNYNLIVKAAQTNAIVYSLFPEKNGDNEDGEGAKDDVTNVESTTTDAQQQLLVEEGR